MSKPVAAGFDFLAPLFRESRSRGLLECAAHVAALAGLHRVEELDGVRDLAGGLEDLRTHGFSDEDAWDIAGITALFGLSNRMANFTSMRPNDEFYLMGRVPRPAKA